MPRDGAALTGTSWRGGTRSGPAPGAQADALLACDFFETVTVNGARMYVLAVIEHATRRIRVLGATAYPTTSWVTQAAKNLVMDLEDTGNRARFLIRDHDGKFPGLFDAVLKDAGIEIVLSGVQVPRMNALMERWVQTCRRELLDRVRNDPGTARRLLEMFTVGSRTVAGFYRERRYPTWLGIPGRLLPDHRALGRTGPPSLNRRRVPR